MLGITKTKPIKATIQPRETKYPSLTHIKPDTI